MGFSFENFIISSKEHFTVHSKTLMRFWRRKKTFSSVSLTSKQMSLTEQNLLTDTTDSWMMNYSAVCCTTRSTTLYMEKKGNFVWYSVWFSFFTAKTDTCFFCAFAFTICHHQLSWRRTLGLNVPWIWQEIIIKPTLWRVCAEMEKIQNSIKPLNLVFMWTSAWLEFHGWYQAHRDPLSRITAEW